MTGRRFLHFRSNCECDKIFHDCLKRIDSFTANTVGSLYFRTSRECLTFGHPKMYVFEVKSPQLQKIFIKMY